MNRMSRNLCNRLIRTRYCCIHCHHTRRFPGRCSWYTFPSYLDTPGQTDTHTCNSSGTSNQQRRRMILIHRHNHRNNLRNSRYFGRFYRRNTRWCLNSNLRDNPYHHNYNHWDTWCNYSCWRRNRCYSRYQNTSLVCSNPHTSFVCYRTIDYSDMKVNSPSRNPCYQRDSSYCCRCPQWYPHTLDYRLIYMRDPLRIHKRNLPHPISNRLDNNYHGKNADIHHNTDPRRILSTYYIPVVLRISRCPDDTWNQTDTPENTRLNIPWCHTYSNCRSANCTMDHNTSYMRNRRYKFSWRYPMFDPQDRWAMLSYTHSDTR